MNVRAPHLLLKTSPFEKHRITTPRLMVEVHLALLPVVAASVVYFGIGALLVILSAVAGAVFTEWLWGPRPTGKRDGKTLFDASAALTGVLLGLTLPPGIPLWMAFLGGFVAIGLGKLIWGGLGRNLFNPALVGRAFLQAAFPAALTTWQAPGATKDILSTRAADLALPFLDGTVDAVTTATPLARMKFEGQLTPLTSLFVGSTAGSLGETSALALLLGGIYLLARRAFDWRIPASILLAAAAMSGLLHVLAPGRFPPPWFMVCSGGLLLGAIYMATDPVTSPLSPRGAWVFGSAIGVLVILIRLFGGLPEGVMYAILLMNAATPLIDRRFQPRAFGRGRKP
ncbi:MAG: RnfABCDGE type electron transport complex subunit D [Candidatus Eisenbacteria bacterium]|uniref:Ion-translocating oxidoreductase complex subunit D n=1 Tax=Eiseniibacteriota bacterium TaxID=2212470 RepID=A0A956RR55_UNCEI|nr:RnfABCDGE type electron transport complex subunit D [Candidatus Eisenbacteria bacterium]